MYQSRSHCTDVMREMVLTAVMKIVVEKLNCNSRRLGLVKEKKCIHIKVKAALVKISVFPFSTLRLKSKLIIGN